MLGGRSRDRAIGDLRRVLVTCPPPEPHTTDYDFEVSTPMYLRPVSIAAAQELPLPAKGENGATRRKRLIISANTQNPNHSDCAGVADRKPSIARPTVSSKLWLR
jgi:hypothetical protein